MSTVTNSTGEEQKEIIINNINIEEEENMNNIAKLGATAVVSFAVGAGVGVYFGGGVDDTVQIQLDCIAYATENPDDYQRWRTANGYDEPCAMINP